MMTSTFSKFTAFVLLMLGIVAVQAQQLNTPAPSPFVKVTQEFALGEVTIEYSRPGVKGRTVFGDLVPYGKIWRTGANYATKITFSDDVKIEGNDVKAGTYAVYTIPSESEWSIMLYSDLKLGGNVAKYDESNEVLRFTAKTVKLDDKLETFTIFMGDITSTTANLVFAWENTMVAAKVEAEIENKIEKQIETALAGPSANFYYRAAVYYYESDKDIDKALTWINKATEGEQKRFWMETWKARILAKAGKKAEALKASEYALKLSQEASNADWVKINEDIIAGLK